MIDMTDVQTGHTGDGHMDDKHIHGLVTMAAISNHLQYYTLCFRGGG